MDAERRFGGIHRLYGEQATAKINHSHIAIIGIGGVGSWVAESLARSYVGELTLIDLDHIAESNINRQIHALTDTLGQAKNDAMAARIAAINPDCKTHIIDDHLSLENISTLIDERFTYAIDCIDEFRIKAALIHYCKRQKIKVLSVGGAGGRVDPTRIQVADLTRAEGDALLARTRKLLRTDYGFARNTRRRFNVPCVYSNEALRYPTDNKGTSLKKSECTALSGLNCANGFGSLSSVTATFGMIASAYVLNKIATT